MSTIQEIRWAELIEGQVSRGKSRAEAARLLAERYPRLAACVAGVPARGAVTADPTAEWEAALTALVASGLSRQRAVSKLAKDRPELLRAYVSAYNLEHADARR